MVDGEGYEERLFEKLDEETTELRETPGADELADVLEVVDTVRTQLGVGGPGLERVREEKAAECGRFDDGIVLDYVDD